jgi:hypothetical protein
MIDRDRREMCADRITEHLETMMDMKVDIQAKHKAYNGLLPKYMVENFTTSLTHIKNAIKYELIQLSEYTNQENML